MTVIRAPGRQPAPFTHNEGSAVSPILAVRGVIKEGLEGTRPGIEELIPFLDIFLVALGKAWKTTVQNFQHVVTIAGQLPHLGHLFDVLPRIVQRLFDQKSAFWGSTMSSMGVMSSKLFRIPVVAVSSKLVSSRLIMIAGAPATTKKRHAAR